jgi:protein phosphatase
MTGGRTDRDALRRIVEEVNRDVRSLGDADAALAGVGTTLSAVLLDGSGGMVVHVGDSRILRYREGALGQLTSDHTVEAEYRREASEAAAPLNPRIGSLLARAIGARETVEAEILEVDLRDGDVLLLVTDGVSKVLETAVLERLLREAHAGESAQAICVRLFEATRAGGPDDDTTVGVVTIREDPARSRSR